MSENKKQEKKVHTYYDISGNSLTRKLKKCPRCGVFMAHHTENNPRWTCGKCSYTEYLKK
jgi:small subunit ribosomal protein S27Ae